MVWLLNYFYFVPEKIDFISKLLNKKNNGLVESINDIRDKEFSGIKLSREEKTALGNFDKYRINILNAQKDDAEFHLRYRQIQVIANLSDWRAFIEPDFKP